MYWLEGALQWRHKLWKPKQNWDKLKSLHPWEQSKKLFLQHCPTGKVPVETNPIPPCTRWRFLLGTSAQTARSGQPVSSHWLPWCLWAQESLVQTSLRLTHTRNSETTQCTGGKVSFTKNLAEDQGLGSCGKSCQRYKLKSWVLFPSQPADKIREEHFPNLFTDYCLNN